MATYHSFGNPKNQVHHKHSQITPFCKVNTSRGEVKHKAFFSYILSCARTKRKTLETPFISIKPAHANVFSAAVYENFLFFSTWLCAGVLFDPMNMNCAVVKYTTLMYFF